MKQILSLLAMETGLMLVTYLCISISNILSYKDAFAYRAVGIPVSRIFTINPEGELKHELTATFQTS